MVARFWCASLVVISLIGGCAPAGPTAAPKPAASTSTAPAEEPQSDPPVQPEPLPEAMENSSDTPAKPDANDKPPTDDKVAADDKPATDEEGDSEFSPKREAQLLAKLEKDPKSVKLLLAAANFMQNKALMTESGDPDLAMFKQSADYLRRAIEADPELAKSNDVLNLEAASEFFYNEAWAWSAERQQEPGLRALKTAIDLGWRDVGRLKTDPELSFLRKSKSFGSLLDGLIQKFTLEAEKQVDALLAEKHDFKIDFDLKDTHGKPISRKEFAGNVLMVNVWGTWCPPCRRELPDLVAAYEKYKSQGFVLVGLNSERETGDEANDIIKAAQKKFGITYRCALASDELFETIPNFEGFPTTIFFDRQGKVRVNRVNVIDEFLLTAIIERLLKEEPGNAKSPE